MEIDAIIISKASTDDKRKMTQNTINTMLAGAGDNKINVFVVEQIDDVDYRKAVTLYRRDEFNYNRFLNFAIDRGQSPWILCANNDLEFTDGWLNALLSAKHPVVSPHTPSDWRQKDLDKNETGHTVGRHFPGWCFMMERRLWNDIGGFDECVTFWCSDDVVVEQLKELGIRPMVVKNSIVHHGVSVTLLAEPAEYQASLTFGNVKIFNEKYGKNLLSENKDYQEYIRKNS